MDFDHIAPDGKLGMRYFGDPTLEAVSEPVRDTEFGSKLAVFAHQLTLTMDEYHGVGLAAPQVGLLKRIFVMRFPDTERLTETLPAPLVVCNPTLELSGDMVQYEEGCLSLPDIHTIVSRPRNAILRFFHVDGREDELELTDLDARVAQHEQDHLFGIMFFDRRRVSKQVSKAVRLKWERVAHRF